MEGDMPIRLPGKRRDERLDDYILRVIQSLKSPVCVNTLVVLTGLAPYRLCKILNRLEMDGKVRKVTNVYHGYWTAV